MPKAGTLPEVPEEKDEDMRQLTEAVIGSLAYHSDTMFTIIKTIRVLRADPKLAQRLLAQE